MSSAVEVPVLRRGTTHPVGEWQVARGRTSLWLRQRALWLQQEGDHDCIRCRRILSHSRCLRFQVSLFSYYATPTQNMWIFQGYMR